jgi:hypothetical protein
MGLESWIGLKRGSEVEEGKQSSRMVYVLEERKPVRKGRVGPKVRIKLVDGSASSFRSFRRGVGLNLSELRDYLKV